MKATKLLLGIFIYLVASQTSFAWEYEYLGYLNNSAEYSQHPANMYHLISPKKIKAYLVGDADVDLYLYQYDNGIWTNVAYSNSRSYVEVLNYNAICADICDQWYAWFVVMKSPNTKGGNYYIQIKD